MRRYVRDPQLREFQERIRAEVARANALAPDTGFAIYAIRDPTQTDRRWGHDDGPPIYVGQTKQFPIRADDHMRDGGQSYASSRCKAGLLKRTMQQWCVPKFEILDTAPTHLTSLIAETVWARRFVWLGYQLANQWPEHQSKEPPQGLLSVPLKRLWNLTAQEAIDDEVSLRLSCRACDVHRSIELETLRPQTPLRGIRSLKLTCPDCDARLLQIARPDPTAWRWAAYQPRSMPPRRNPIR